MIEINYWAVLGCAVLANIIGAVWYGKIFKKVWLEAIGITDPKEQ